MATINKNKEAQYKQYASASILKLKQSASLGFPDHKSEFISELSTSISKWRGIPGKESAAYATAYENVLYSLLTPEQTD